jgi:hypothetical protein
MTAPSNGLVPPCSPCLPTAAIPPVQAGDQAGKGTGVTAYVGQGWG